MSTNYVYKIIDSPIGELKIIASHKGLSAIQWKNDHPKRMKLTPISEDKTNPFIIETEQQLKEYFQGERQSFNLTLDFKGTDFQKEVWKALLAIPYGETRSYKDIAIQLNRPKAVRAVGAANGKNPIAIIAACHRVISASGQLTGFAGGLEAKAFLLSLEGNKTESMKEGLTRNTKIQKNKSEINCLLSSITN